MPPQNLCSASRVPASSARIATQSGGPGRRPTRWFPYPAGIPFPPRDTLPSAKSACAWLKVWRFLAGSDGAGLRHECGGKAQREASSFGGMRFGTAICPGARMPAAMRAGYNGYLSFSFSRGLASIALPLAMIEIVAVYGRNKAKAL